jgi:hypothetical protein
MPSNFSAPHDPFRGSFRDDRFPTSGDPTEVCPQTTARYEQELNQSRLADFHYDNEFPDHTAARVEGLIAYRDVADDLARRDAIPDRWR